MSKYQVASAIGFAVLAAAGRRYHWSTESRYQIAAFWGLALFFEVEMRSLLDTRGSVTGLVMNGVAATIAIVTVKWLMEGLPPWIPH